jgi:predicted phosphodiesterase
MRVAIVSDVHGNLRALEAVFRDIDQQGVDQIWCGGDVALKGSHPAEVVDLLHQRCSVFVKGNTDAYLLGELPLNNYGNPAHWKHRHYGWTVNELGAARLEKIRSYAFSHRVTGGASGDLMLVHANPTDMETAIYPTAPTRVIRHLLAGVDCAVLAFGHLHTAFHFELDGVQLVDVASAGNPRDRDTRPAYGLFTLESSGWKIELRRVEYALREAANDFHQRGVPGSSRLARKLIEARYPR